MSPGSTSNPKPLPHLNSPLSPRWFRTAAVGCFAAAAAVCPLWSGGWLSSDHQLSPRATAALWLVTALSLCLAGLHLRLRARWALLARTELALTSLLISLVLAECVLRWMARQNPWSHWAGRPTPAYQGLRVGDLKLKILLPYAESQVTPLYTGHWQHKGDRNGFRNPHERADADVVILGDSFAYGWGVSVDQTPAQLLERATGLKVTSLGVPGIEAFTSWAIFEQFGRPLRPSAVILFLNFTDPDDGASLLRAADEREWLAAGSPERLSPTITPPPTTPQRAPTVNLGIPYLVRTADVRQSFLYLILHQWFRGEERVPALLDPKSRGWDIERRAIRKLAMRCKSLGIRFFIAPTLGRFGPVVRSSGALPEEADGMEMIDTSALDPGFGKPYYLLLDGHLSELGNRKLSEVLAAALRAQPRRSAGDLFEVPTARNGRSNIK